MLIPKKNKLEKWLVGLGVVAAVFLTLFAIYLVFLIVCKLGVLVF
jgi:hypothetical protein